MSTANTATLKTVGQKHMQTTKVTLVLLAV